MQNNKISAADLRQFLTFLAPADSGMKSATDLLKEKRPWFESSLEDTQAWCHFYEMTLSEYIATTSEIIGSTEKLREIAQSDNQIQAMASAIDELDSDVDQFISSVSAEELEEFKERLPSVLGIGISFLNSLHCILTFGCYINDLIEQGRDGNEQALFNAIRIDPTVLGCQTVINRMSRARLLDDVKFFARLKAALNGKLRKREQVNFQKMRIVLRLLYEAGAGRLTDDELYDLFVSQLNLYAATSKYGDVVKNLRKFTNQYMKDHANTKKASF